MADVKQLLILDSSKDTYTCSVVKFKNRAFEKIRFQVDSTEFSSDLCWTDRKLKKKKKCEPMIMHQENILNIWKGPNNVW